MNEDYKKDLNKFKRHAEWDQEDLMNHENYSEDVYQAYEKLIQALQDELED